MLPCILTRALQRQAECCRPITLSRRLQRLLQVNLNVWRDTTTIPELVSECLRGCCMLANIFLLCAFRTHSLMSCARPTYTWMIMQLLSASWWCNVNVHTQYDGLKSAASRWRCILTLEIPDDGTSTSKLTFMQSLSTLSMHVQDELSKSIFMMTQPCNLNLLVHENGSKHTIQIDA